MTCGIYAIPSTTPRRKSPGITRLDTTMQFTVTAVSHDGATQSFVATAQELERFDFLALAARNRTLTIEAC